jgi:hypothetical protein
MDFNFNWSAVSGGAPYATLSSLGIAFNSVSIEKLGNPEKVMIGFDEDQYIIGIKAYEGEPNIKPYEFASRINKGWIRIGCKDFIKYLQAISGIEFSPSKRYVATYDAKSRVLLIAVRGKYDDE